MLEPATPMTAADWKIKCLNGLDAAAERVLKLLRLAHGEASPSVEPMGGGDSAASPALDRIVSLFGLTGFERDVLLLAVTADLKADIGNACGALNGDSAQAWPSFNIAIIALPDPYWEALAPDQPLRRHRLVVIDGEDGPDEVSPVLNRLTAPEPVLHYLLGGMAFDREIAALTTPAPAPPWIAPSAIGFVEELAWLLHTAEEHAMAVLLRGPADLAEELAAAACHCIGVNLRRINESGLPHDPAALDRLCRIWLRDSRLGKALLLVVADEGGGDRLARFIDRLEGGILVAGDVGNGLAASRRALLHRDLPHAGAEDRQALWRAALHDVATPELFAALPRIADQFELAPTVIFGCVQAALEKPEELTDTPEKLANELWRLAKLQGRARLAGLAERIPTRARLNDLILADETKNIISRIITHQRRRHAVRRQWGVDEAAPGFGLCALFSGASGAGKTMAAEVIAAELDLDLFRIDLSAVTDKYIGETEKNLRRLFDAAESTGAVLLFDEADALFGKRSEVKDSHDRHANGEVSYLLQRIETYRGVAILTTNMAPSIDTAFLRRFNYIAPFSPPDTGARRAIWKNIFPASIGAKDLNWDLLSRIPLSGGQIRTVAINAAMLAADAGRPPGMTDLRNALIAEYAKQQRTLSPTEFGGWPD